MQIKYICPFWGSSELSARQFATKALEAGYDGIEMNVPNDAQFVVELKEVLADTNCSFIAQQWLPPATETVEEYRNRMLE